MQISRQWTIFTFLAAFSIYWTVNLILWFPWSISAVLGMTLMLTIAPLIWAVSIFYCLKKYQWQNLINGAILTSIIYISTAVIADYIFFGLIRNALKELYHPTTFYGYLFLICLPFILIFLFPKQLSKKNKIAGQDFIKYSLLGIFSVTALILIIKFNITI